MMRGLGLLMVLAGTGLMLDNRSEEGRPARCGLALFLWLVGTSLLAERGETDRA